MNREQWLNELAIKAAPAIARRLSFNDEEMSLRLSCGFPAKQGKRKPIAAQLVPPTASAEFNAEIFVSPTLADKHEIARAVLPLVVAAVSGDYQQRNIYREALRSCGLNGSMMPSWAAEIIEALPAYPHAAIELQAARKQSTRLIKAYCAEHAYIVRLSRATFDMGAPICPLCNTSMITDYATTGEN